MNVPTPEVVSLGCRLNIAESETIRALLGGRDTVVVNSCAVTGEAVKQTRAAIRRASRARPGAELVVTGCAATIDAAGFAAMPEVSRVVANAVKLSPASWGPSASPSPSGEGLGVGPLLSARPLVEAPHPNPSSGEQRPALFRSSRGLDRPDDPEGEGPRGARRHARAFVPVQNGCDHACTFCIIPQGRGTSRSVPVDAVVERIAVAVDAGHREVVLTGVDLTSYGPDLPGSPTLGGLCETVLARVPGLARLRLSSLDSVEIDSALFELLASEARVMPHVHLSLQAGADLILKRMKRRHGRREAIALVERLKARRPAMAIGADLIAGFPTETDALFADTLALLDDCDIVHAHIFPYSAREGTPAARMPPVPVEVRRARATRLRAAAAARKARWLRSLVGSAQDVLVEKPGDRGHAGNFADVRLGGTGPVGDVRRVMIAGVDGDALLTVMN